MGSGSGTEEEDQDALPFALDEERVRGEAQDAAIGAFVRSLQEAPPLRNQSAPSLTLSSAMLELRQLRETLDTAKTLLVPLPS